MRRFHSYGPVDCERHFCVPRRELVEACLRHLIDDVDKGGHYFTIWAPRQTGKTWLMREVKKEIESRYPDHFQVGMMSMQGIVLKEAEPDTEFLSKIPGLFRDALGVNTIAPGSWEKLAEAFHREVGLFQKPVVLFMDEFDSLPSKVIDRLVTLFRDIYLKRESYLLHGLALIGVRAVLGMGSDRGSPFNVQRSLHVPNFVKKEVEDLFRQYQEESGQEIAPSVVQSVFDATHGQPGLVGWFGELLTEKYNPGSERILGQNDWNRVYRKAKNVEWNNSLLNLIKKATGIYVNSVVQVFSSQDIRFSLRQEWCSYLYLNGILDYHTALDENGEEQEYCRFSSPFIQECLFDALADQVAGKKLSVLALEPLDDLKDVFEEYEINLVALLSRYKDYLARLGNRGINPWQGQPRRTDLHLTEAVGHFHLYAWLRDALEYRCAVSPEFPTGNGKVDLHIRCEKKEGIIEVKSFRSQAHLSLSVKQAGRYARSLGKESVCVAIFVPSQDETVLSGISGVHDVEGIRVDVAAIGWG